jgi:hypothetical protein
MRFESQTIGPLWPLRPQPQLLHRSCIRRLGECGPCLGARADGDPIGSHKYALGTAQGTHGSAAECLSARHIRLAQLATRRWPAGHLGRAAVVQGGDQTVGLPTSRHHRLTLAIGVRSGSLDVDVSGLRWCSPVLRISTRPWATRFWSEAPTLAVQLPVNALAVVKIDVCLEEAELVRRQSDVGWFET